MKRMLILMFCGVAALSSKLALLPTIGMTRPWLSAGKIAMTLLVAATVSFYGSSKASAAECVYSMSVFPGKITIHDAADPATALLTVGGLDINGAISLDPVRGLLYGGTWPSTNLPLRAYDAVTIAPMPAFDIPLSNSGNHATALDAQRRILFHYDTVGRLLRAISLDDSNYGVVIASLNTVLPVSNGHSDIGNYIALDSIGERLFLAGSSGGAIVAIDISGLSPAAGFFGAVTDTGHTGRPLGDSGNGLAVDDMGRRVFAISADNTVRVFSADPPFGFLFDVSVPTPGHDNGLIYAPDNDMLFVGGAGSSSSTAIVVSTGVVTSVGDSPWSGVSFTLDYAQICGTTDEDADNDGVLDDQDICPGFNDSVDADSDGVPDGCDPCPNDSENDADGDGTCGDVDTCPGGDDNQNADGDSLPDFCDVCPLDPENDADGDGICESDDNCPLIANDNQNDIDEDNIGDACDDDIDGDSVSNEDDNCPYDTNPEQTDTDGDGAGDICDTDDDNDGVLDANDACVSTPLGEVVNADGCSIVELCPCVHPIYGDKWKNHGAYVRCIAHTSEDFVSAGLITEIEKDAIVSEAGESSCGHKK